MKEKLYKYIDKLANDNILFHGDFHPDNLLIMKDKAVIIDCMTAAKGNPLADVARTSVMLKFGDIPRKSNIEKILINFFRKKLYLEYINISKVNINQIRQWELPIAAARLIEWLPESEKRNLLNFVTSELDKLY
nr:MULTISPECIES: phosphotransferase [Clostridium]